MAIVTAKTLGWYAPLRVARAMRRVRRYPVVPVALLTLLLVIPAVFAPLVAPYDPLKGSLAKRLTPPVWEQGGTIEHLLGTDKLGRDILSRMIHGARVSLMVSLVAIFVGGITGTGLGLMSGYFGGKVDALIMRLVDISLSLPTILLALVLVAAVGPSFRTVIGVLVVLLWARYARLVRSSMLDVLDSEFVKLTRIKGLAEWKVVWKHCLRNAAIAPLTFFAIIAGVLMTGSVVTESVFSWPGTGLLVVDAVRARDFQVVQAVVIVFAGIFILTNLLVDILYAYLDPRIRYQ